MPATDVRQTGIIYILKHKSGTTVKVGKTLVSASSRHADYTRKYDLKGFALFREFGVPASALSSIERHAHSLLSDYKLSGIEGAMELFSCGGNVAVKAVEKAIRENDDVQRREARDRADAEQRKKVRDGFDKAWLNSTDYDKYEYLMSRAKDYENSTVPIALLEGFVGPVVVCMLGSTYFAFTFGSSERIWSVIFLWLSFFAVSMMFGWISAMSKKTKIIEERKKSIIETILAMRKEAETIKTDFRRRYYSENL